MMTAQDQDNCRLIVNKMTAANRITVFSGAGISKESGIPTFRENGGLWENYRIEDVATPEAFFRDPKLVWTFYHERRRAIKKAKPNPAHQAIAKWQNGNQFIGIVTQNIDNLHQDAGSRNICELHGNIWKSRCIQCGMIEVDLTCDDSQLPHCTFCKGLLRPHIVWFGEELDHLMIQESVQWMRNADLLFVIGTSGVVEPAASFVRDAASRGVFVVEVNVEETELTPFAKISLFGSASEIVGEWLRVSGDEPREEAGDE